MKSEVSIMKMASISAAGSQHNEIWETYISGKQKLTQLPFDEDELLAGTLDEKSQSLIDGVRAEEDLYNRLDDSVLYAIYVSRLVMDADGKEDTIGINFGSSRGATKSMEHHHAHFKENGHCVSIASPSTTLGNISSWVSHDLGIKGPTISHSITCSTALHSLLNGIAWLRSGMSNRFIVGGSESAVTPFTIAQLKALRIYANVQREYTCRPLDMTKRSNTMVLGDAAAAMLIEQGHQPQALSYITGLGYSTEILTHSVSISTDAKCFQRSMAMCLEGMNADDVDAIVLHAPGTIKGDQAEVLAIEKVFMGKIPALTSNKWCVGHTFGASGMMSMEMAVMMLIHNQYSPIPYLVSQKSPKRLRNIMVNAVGFGGNAVSIMVSKNN